MHNKLAYSVLLSFIIIDLTACSSANHYVKTRQSAYLHSQEYRHLKLPKGLTINSEKEYIIPPVFTHKPTQLPDLQPPTD